MLFDEIYEFTEDKSRSEFDMISIIANKVRPSVSRAHFCCLAKLTLVQVLG